MLKKLLGAKKEHRESSDADLLDAKGGATVLDELEKCRRSGKPPSGRLLIQAGDMYRDLGSPQKAADFYVQAADRYADSEAWTPAEHAVRRVRRMGDMPDLTQRRLMVEVRLALGRRQAQAACVALERLCEALSPADSGEISRMVDLVDEDLVGATPEVEIALAEALNRLGRPEKAIERLRIGRMKAQQGAAPDAVVAQLDGLLSSAQEDPTPIEMAGEAGQVPQNEDPPAAAADAEGEDIEADIAEPDDPQATAGWAVEDDEGEDFLDGLDSALLDEPELVENAHAAAPPPPAEEPPSEPLPPAEDGEVDVQDAAPPTQAATEATGESEAYEDVAVSAPTPEEPGAPEPESEDPVQETEAEEHDAPSNADDTTDDADGDFVNLESLIGAEQEDTRFVGEDRRSQYGGDTDEHVDDLIEQLREGIRKAVPEDEAETHYQYGLGWMQMERYDLAVESFQRAYRSEDYRVQAAQGLAQALFSQGDHRIATRVCEAAIEQSGASDAEAVGILYWLARSLEELGRTDEAVDLYERICMYQLDLGDARSRLRTLTE